MAHQTGVHLAMNTLLFNVINALLKLNARFYGASASHEVCRDLVGMWRVNAFESATCKVRA